jgi:tetratricopeptide (TPR) repeat protein
MAMRNLIVVVLLLVACNIPEQNTQPKSELVYRPEKEVLERYVTNGAHRFSYFSPEWQSYLDSAIKENPTIAYVYQQKAMPLFKMRKYEAGLPYLNKAVELDSIQYLDYRAFMKCIFSKDYTGAIQDFNESKKIKGEYGHVMDHSYDFYLGLCYIQLNEYDSAARHLTKSIAHTEKQNGEKWIHYLDEFYLGIAQLELKNYAEAIRSFDKALKTYTNFADAEYYKAVALGRQGKRDETMDLYKLAAIHFKQGYTINEDNAIYEKYPYQLFPFHFAN